MTVSQRQKQFLTIFGLLLCLTIPYLSLQQKIVSDLHGDLCGSMIQVLRWALKLSLFSFVVVTLYIWSLLLFKKIGVAKVMIIPMNLFLFSAQMVISLYYEYFSELPHIQLITLIPEGFQVRAQVFHQLFSLREWIIVFGCLGSIVLSFFMVQFGVYRQKYFRLISLCILMFYGSYELMNFQRKDIHREFQFGYSYVSTSYGFTYAYALMVQDLLPNLNKVNVPFPGKINPRHRVNYANRETREKPLKNVIMVQVESLGKIMLFYELGGKKVMPFLNSLVPQSVFFDNFVAQHSGGGSSDAELSTLLSLLPLRSHSGLRTADYTKVTSLLHRLKKHGYTTCAMHANHRQFYNRAYAYPQLGFDIFYSLRDYQGAARGLQSRDLEFFKQSLDKILALPAPYFAYLITMQGHGPYKNYSQETRLKFQFEPDFTQTQIDYICTLHEVDQALEFFITQLDRLTILDRSILVVFADEFPFIFNTKNEKIENIPLMIIDPGLDPRVETKLGSTLSIASTVTELLGIPEADHWLGDSLLSSPEDRVVLFNNLTVMRRDGSEFVAQKDVQYKKFVDYSRSILE